MTLTAVELVDLAIREHLSGHQHPLTECPHPDCKYLRGE